MHHCTPGSKPEQRPATTPPAPPQLLIVTTGPQMEVFSTGPVRIHHARGFADLKGPRAELVAEQILERELPFAFKHLHAPGLRRFAAWVEARTIQAEQQHLETLRTWRAIDQFGRDLRGEGRR